MIGKPCLEGHLSPHYGRGIGLSSQGVAHVELLHGIRWEAGSAHDLLHDKSAQFLQRNIFHGPAESAKRRSHCTHNYYISIHHTVSPPYHHESQFVSTRGLRRAYTPQAQPSR